MAALLYALLSLTATPTAVDAATITSLKMSGYQTCSNTQNPALQCLNQGFYSRMQLDFNVQFNSFTDVLNSIPWSIVDASGAPISNTAGFVSCPEGQTCIPVPDQTSISLLLARPRLGNAMTFVGYTPLGYILLNFTNTSAPFPTNASWYNSSATCSGYAGAMFEPPGGTCANMVPPYLNYDFIRSSGVCGLDPYEPVITAALSSGNVQFVNNGGGSYAQCLSGAACYPCANSSNPYQQNSTVMYATLAFGQCRVFRVEPQTTIYADLFVNVTTAGTLHQYMYVGGMESSSLQNVMKLSRLAPTMRASLLLNTPNGIASQTADYIIVCDGANNSTAPAGVMGPFNRVFNLSGYVPSFQWNDIVRPFLLSNDTMNGGFVALSAADFENSFEQTTQDVFPCGKSQISPVSFGPTYAFYTSQSLVDQACAVNDLYSSTDGSNASVASGRCVPGYFDSYGKTVCQRFTRMQNYSDAYLAAGMPLDFPPSEDLMYSYNVRNPQFTLFLQDDDEDNEATDTDGNGQMFLMQTAPSITDQLMVSASVLLDISTDSVPYVTPSSIVIRYAVAPQAGVLCRYNQQLGRGYIQQTVCQLGGAFPLEATLKIFSCDPDIRFLTNETQAGWSFSGDDRTATYDSYVYSDPTDNCFTTSFIAFYVPNSSTTLSSANRLLFSPCTLEVNARPTSDVDDVNVKVSGTMACALGEFRNRTQGYSPPDNSLSVWQMLLIVLLLALVLIFIVAFSVLIAVFVEKGKTPQDMME